ncbi:family 43 glycosylhydrolase [Telluria sp. Tellsp104]
MKGFYFIFSVCGAVLLAACATDSGAGAGTEIRDTALIQNFIAPDPLRGENGMPASPGAPAKYGPINLGLDVDGNAIEATSASSVAYFDGHYYLYGTSYACGSFDYAPGANMTPVLPTEPNSFYRYCGFTIYESKDLMNWKLKSRFIPQDPDTGRVYPLKLARVLYSSKTRLYNMWFANGQGGRGPGRLVMQSTTPFGPWSKPRPILNPLDPTGKNLLLNFELGTGPGNQTWMAASHGGIRVFKLNDEKTGITEQVDIKVPTTILNGGVGIYYENGWWYVTGSPSCANCVATSFAYIMARDPHGPWISPVTGASEGEIEPGILSQDSGNAQSNGIAQLPDGKGGSASFVPFKHYIATKAKAPTADSHQPGDANLALSGIWWYPMSYGADGKIKPMKVEPSSSFPLAAPVRSSVPPAYQADLSITAASAVEQTWTEAPGSVVASILPAVFQRTVDNRPPIYSTKPFTSLADVQRMKERAKAEGYVLRPQEPLMNAPLVATLELPDGTTQTWSLDPRTVAWAPHVIPLNLTRPFKGGGRFTLRLSTSATNGGYGVAVGPQLPHGAYTHVEHGSAHRFDAGMALRTAASSAPAPVITQQPFSVRVPVGGEAGFVVGATGEGLGYQWKHDGKPILAPDGMNESTALSLRIDQVSEKDAGIYTVDVFNQSGSVSSVPVRLEIVPKEEAVRAR